MASEPDGAHAVPSSAAAVASRGGSPASLTCSLCAAVCDAGRRFCRRIQTNRRQSSTRCSPGRWIDQGAKEPSSPERRWAGEQDWASGVDHDHEKALAAASERADGIEHGSRCLRAAVGARSAMHSERFGSSSRWTRHEPGFFPGVCAVGRRQPARVGVTLFPFYSLIAVSSHPQPRRCDYSAPHAHRRTETAAQD